MTIKIEKKEVPSKQGLNGSEFAQFVVALESLEIGDSFLYEIISTHRVAISVLKILKGYEIRTRREGATWRVGRTA